MPRLVNSGVWPGRAPSEPSLPGRITSSTTSLTRRPSGVTTSRWIDSGRGIVLGGLFHLLGLLVHLVDGADQVERLFRQVVMLPLQDLPEGAYRLGDRHVLALQTGELLGHEERLRQEFLDLAGPRHDELVLFRQLVDPEDGDDVLEVLVTLQDPLHATRGVIVLLADHPGVEDARR